ncbi:LytR C-terminal domain-containing protein [Candidatus Dojkabacteria bacterium]|jgi:hypothetical protein|nr:LytR C-terminal domain-containing protein [Candidatus Dojkabacteria bacterium]
MTNRSRKKRIVRKEERSRKKGLNIRKSLTVAGVLLITVITTIFAIQFTRFLSIKTQSSVDKQALSKYLIKRDNVKSTLIVLQDLVNDKIAGAWYVVSNQKTNTSFVYYVPPGVYMRDYSGKVSEYVSVGDLKYAGNIINHTREIEYSIWQLSNLTGITVDSYIWFKPDSLAPFSNLFNDVSDYSLDDFNLLYLPKNEITKPALAINSITSKYSLFPLITNIAQYKKLAEGIDTNMSSFALLERIKEINRDITVSGVTMFNLSQLWATNIETTSDEREVNVINYPEIDSRLDNVINILKGRNIEKEQVKVEVYNGSDIDGLASRYFRKIKNAGLDVVRYENAPVIYEKTQIYIPDQSKYIYSLDLVKRILVVTPTIINSRPDFMTTGDIVIVLGKDMEQEAVWK